MPVTPDTTPTTSTSTTTPRRIVIDQDLRPAYYDDFRCLAAGCKWSCCKYVWNITFRKKDYLTLKRQNYSPELKKLIEQNVRRVRTPVRGGGTLDAQYAQIVMDSGVCPMLREDGLCGVQVEQGFSVLPDVCRTYPRSAAYLPSGYRERSLSVSCEGVLAQLWELPEGIEFRTDPLPKVEWKMVTFSEENPLPMWFSVVREWCIDMLQDRRFSLPERIWIMGLGLRELADGETDMERWTARAAALPGTAAPGAILPKGDRELALFLSGCLRTLMALPDKDSDANELRRELIDSMGGHGDIHHLTLPFGPYRDARARYAERFGDREYFMENLMVSVFFHTHMPHLASTETLWKDYVNFCNLYAIYRFMSVMSCREGAAGDRDELFRLLVFIGRRLLHNSVSQAQLRDEFFQNDSATLAHMAILLCG